MKKIILALVFTFFALPCMAQNSITFDYKDAPVRNVLEQLFKQSKKQFSIDNSVVGFVTMTIENQSFETTLKLIMRASSIPLTYTLENNVYFVKMRQFTPVVNISPVIEKTENRNNILFERIPLTFIDPLDLQIVLGRILNINQFTRYGNGFGFNFGGGLGGNFGNNGNANGGQNL